MSDTPSAPITVKVEIELPFERVTNAIIGAFEGGSNYWLSSAEYTVRPDDVPGNPLYAEAEFWDKGGKMKLLHENPEDGDVETTSEIGVIQLRNGVNIMAAKAPRHFANLFNENDDAETHDVFMQMVLFGDIIYG